MSRGTDRCGIDLGSDEKSDSVRTELIEEGGEEIHGLEGMNVGWAGKEGIMECRNDKEDEVCGKANYLHVLSSVELIVDEECYQ